jgi:hypothetical protein
MSKRQTTHVKVVREWCTSLGVLTAISMTRQEAEMKLAAFVPMLQDRFTDGAFTAASLEFVARNCAKGFPTYPELALYLGEWWRLNRPALPQLPPPPLPPERVPPTDEERAYVAQQLRDLVAEFKAKPLYHEVGDNDLGDQADQHRPRASHFSPRQLAMAYRAAGIWRPGLPVDTNRETC